MRGYFGCTYHFVRIPFPFPLWGILGIGAQAINISSHHITPWSHQSFHHKLICTVFCSDFARLAQLEMCPFLQLHALRWISLDRPFIFTMSISMLNIICKCILLYSRSVLRVVPNILVAQRRRKCQYASSLSSSPAKIKYCLHIHSLPLLINTARPSSQTKNCQFSWSNCLVTDFSFVVSFAQALLSFLWLYIYLLHSLCYTALTIMSAKQKCKWV